MSESEKLGPTQPLGQRGVVVAAFPAAGKSYYAQRHNAAVDSDSSGFSWQYTSAYETRRRHPDWPANYMRHIADQLASGRTVLVSTHAEVRQALYDAGIPSTLVYPSLTAREEYRDRMHRRESPAPLIAKVVDELWSDALVDCAEQRGCVHVVLRPGEYLSDVIA